MRRELGDRARSSLLEAMRGPSTKAFKRGFLKNLLRRLQACRNGAASKVMSLQERKRAIKLSADVAMAAARGGGARWPRALAQASSSAAASPAGKAKRCKSIVRRCRRRRRMSRGMDGCAGLLAAALSGGEVARRLVERRTKTLRRMVPGGELLDEASLIHEAIDYVVHLHAQVDVLRRISRAVPRSSISSSGRIVPSTQLKEGTIQV